VDLANQEWGVFLDSRRNGDFDIARASWIADYPDPHTFLEAFTSASQNNDTGYASPLFDRIVLEACTRTGEVLRSETARRELLAAIEASPAFADIRGRLRPGGSTLWADLLAAIEAFDRAGDAGPGGAAGREAHVLAARLLLFEAAEEILARDMPAIPVFFYESVQFWPPELEGMELNALDYHPPKFLRWRDGRRPEGSRLADFPRISPRARSAAQAAVAADGGAS
jgi:ABC-type oligopeptide transport system substrate-binding subunit